MSNEESKCTSQEQEATAASDANEGDSDNLFVEHEHAATEMGYDHGKIPRYVATVWVIALLSFAAYMIKYALPDLGAWGGP